MKKAQQRKLKRKVKTPGNRTSVHFKKKRPNYAHCGICRKKLTRTRLAVNRFKKMTKMQRRPERPYPELCSKCMREKIKQRLR